MATANDNPMSNTSVSRKLTNNFLAAVGVNCSSETAAVLVCDFENIVAFNCDATLTCANSSNITSKVCDAPQTAAALVQTFAATPLSADQSAAMQTLTIPYIAGEGSAPSDQAAAYIASRCQDNVSSAQSVAFPKVMLTDCHGVTLTGINSLDLKTRCAVGALSELVPPDPVLLSEIDVPPVPIWENPLQLTITVTAAGVVLAIAVGVGLYLRGRYGPLPTPKQIQLVTTTAPAASGGQWRRG